MPISRRIYGSFLLAAAAGLACCQKINDAGGLSPKANEIGAAKACEIASASAAHLGLGSFETAHFTANLRPVQGAFNQKSNSPREWCLVYPNGTRAYVFRIDTVSGELIGYDDTGLTRIKSADSIPGLGGFVSTRQGFKDHVAVLLRKLGVQPPAFMFLSLGYDHQGRLTGDTRQMPEASFTVASRRYTLSLDRLTGRLAKYEVLRNPPSESTVPEFYRTIVNYGKAADSAIAFAKKLGFVDASKDRLYGSLTVTHGSEMAHWIFQHNRYQIKVNAVTNEVIGFYNLSVEDRYQDGDKRIYQDKEDLKKLVAKTGSILNIDPSAKLQVDFEEPFLMIGRGQALMIVGDYLIGTKSVARLKFDPYRGELLSIDINPHGLPPASVY